MVVTIPIAELPIELSLDEAVEAAYGEALDGAEETLRQRMSTRIECDMLLVPYLCVALRRRLRRSGRGGSLKCRFVSGAPREGEAPTGLIAAMARDLAEHVRSADPGAVIIIPHLDLLTTTTRSGFSDNTREMIALLHENPEVTILGFKDPSLELPEVVERIFSAQRSLVGLPREALPRLLLRREAKKLGHERFDPFQLYKYVSGLNAVRLRQIMSHLQDRLDYDPQNPASLRQLYADLRDLTLSGSQSVPRVDLEADIGGYERVKEKIRKDILELYDMKSQKTSAREVKAIEELIPKGIIFEGPPGTGKTFFAKAIATALDATAIVVSGPELKSKWVGESEQNLRQIFQRARQSAPAIIIFDELDSFAVRRGTMTGSGVEHSMVNQLLTEMDGFRKEELVFVIGTTNFAESLDGALLRPGRFELTIRIPYPSEADRRAILELYVEKLRLEFDDSTLDHLVRKTGGYANLERKIRFSGDHLDAICRALARERVRGGPSVVTHDEIDTLLGETFAMRPPTAEERRTIAVHEAGHALTATFLKHASAPEKVSIEGIEDSPIGGYVMQERRAGDHVLSRHELRDQLSVLLAGRLSEQQVLGDISAGAENDLQRATGIARQMVERWGMSEDFSSMVFVSPSADDPARLERPRVAEATERRIDAAVEGILEEARERAARLLEEHRAALDAMAEELVEKRVIERETIDALIARHAPGYGSSAP